MDKTNNQKIGPRIGLYIHWPFCKAKCPYCDFNSHVRAGIDESQFQQAMLNEMRYFHTHFNSHKLHSIFFGGGTPSLMSPKLVGALLDAAQKLFGFEDEIEISLEANPTSVEAENFMGYRAAGVNRLSLGVQSFNEKDLKFLGRQHSAGEAIAAIKLAEKHFPRFSFDLIYALPDQTMEAWQAELNRALDFAVGHISLYQLTIEPNTGFAQQYQRGAFALPAEPLAAALYDYTGERLAQNGFNHYEVSNYAKPNQQSRHNMLYWQYDDYIGIGAGAHSRVQHNGKRHAISTLKQPERWLAAALEKQNGIEFNDILTHNDAMREALLMGLRLKDGVDLSSWRTKFNSDLLREINPIKLKTLIDNGDIILSDTHFSATEQGRLRLSAVLDFLLN